MMADVPKHDLCAAIRASFENAERLLQDAGYLLEYGCFPTSYALSILAQEEFAKAFLLHLAHIKVIPWDSDVCQALRQHTCKQLVAMIMEYLNSEWERYLATLEIPRQKTFPRHIADALNIIRHEKIPRERAFSWLEDEEAICDSEARRIADGSVDKQKQNAFYVDVAKTGQIASTPFGITSETASTEFPKN